jgi:phosphatidylserine/phosphatidylglycerophosphate/cardiolipin synthase-like enzyme
MAAPVLKPASAASPAARLLAWQCGLVLFLSTMLWQHAPTATALAPTPSDVSGVSIPYSPAEDLQAIDVAMIDGAQKQIDMAAFVLTAWPVMSALVRAADRGVKVHILLDGSELQYEHPSRAFQILSARAGVSIRVNRANGALMHLKSYCIERL